MVHCKAEFFSGGQGKLFSLIRTPEDVKAHIVYLSPLFEEANQTRHMLTRSAISVYELGIESIVFDHYGCGDSEGELFDATLQHWQQDIITQLSAVKSTSSKPVYLTVILSAALLLSDEIIALIDGLLLVQPEFNGKKFTRQLKRMALATNLSQADGQESEIKSSEAESLEIAGYELTPQLMTALTMQSTERLAPTDKKCMWFEWQAEHAELPNSRANQLQAFKKMIATVEFISVQDSKYWHATELRQSTIFLEHEHRALTEWLLQKAGTAHE